MYKQKERDVVVIQVRFLIILILNESFFSSKTITDKLRIKTDLNLKNIWEWIDFPYRDFSNEREKNSMELSEIIEMSFIDLQRKLNSYKSHMKYDKMLHKIFLCLKDYNLLMNYIESGIVHTPDTLAERMVEITIMNYYGADGISWKKYLSLIENQEFNSIVNQVKKPMITQF